MIVLLYTVHVLICFFLIAVVLLQQGKGADLSVFGGGATQTAFGARGAATVLHKMTVISFILFIVTTLGIGVYQSKQSSSGIFEGLDDEAAATVPATSDEAADATGDATADEDSEAPAEEPEGAFAMESDEADDGAVEGAPAADDASGDAVDAGGDDGDDGGGDGGDGGEADASTGDDG